MSKIALIDYGAGNIQSVHNALEKINSDQNLGLEIIKTNSPSLIDEADYIILPGVGSFKACMQGIEAVPALKEALDRNVLTHKKPFMGICVGMQLLCDKGMEFGEYHGLGYIKGHVVPFDLDKSFKIPHMGWNKITKKSAHPLLHDIQDNDYLYFVHSYYMETDENNIALSCNYGHSFPALIIKDNIIGAQFHPEKSQNVGLTLLRNFVTWKI